MSLSKVRKFATGPGRRLPRFVFMTGCTWSGPGGIWKLHRLVEAAGEPRVTSAVTFECEDPHGDFHEMSLAQVLEVMDRGLNGRDEHEHTLVPFVEELDDVLTAPELIALHRERYWLREWICGDPEGDVLAESPRDGVAPSVWRRPAKRQGRGKAQARLLVAMANDGLPMANATFLRRLANFEASGGSLISLMTKSQRDRVLGKHCEVPEELLLVLSAYASRAVADNTLDLQAHLIQAERFMREHSSLDPAAYAADIKVSTLKALLRGKRITAPSDSRAGKAGRPAKVQGSFLAGGFLENVQVDGFDLPLFVLDQYDEPINAAALVVIDVRTRVIVALLIVPQGYNAQDVCSLVFEAVKGGPIWPGVEPALPALPVRVDVAPRVLQQLGTSGKDARTLTADRQTLGSAALDNAQVNVGLATLGALREIGCHVDIAPPGTGVAKALIESFFQTFGIALQTWPGAKGRTNKHRGREPQQGMPVARELVESAIRLWIDLGYHNTFHRGLGATPREAWIAETLTLGGIPLDVTPVRAWQLLPESKADHVVNDEGIRHANHNYDCPEIQALKPATQGDTHFDPRPVPIRFHPYDDSYILVRDFNGVPRVVPKVDLDSPQPFLQDMRALILWELRHGNSKPRNLRQTAVAMIGDALRQAAARLEYASARPSSSPVQPAVGDDNVLQLWESTLGERGR